MFKKNKNKNDKINKNFTKIRTKLTKMTKLIKI